MQVLNRLHFLIHGFCYAEMAQGGSVSGVAPALAPFLARENACAEQWRARLGDLGRGGALAIIPWPGTSGGPSAHFIEQAASILGERCLVLECPDCLDAAFWPDEDPGFDRALRAELQGAFVGARLTCNNEEIVTDLHCLACCRRLREHLARRRLALDPARVRTEAWGASFDGCVTKYSVTLRRLLGLGHAVDIDYGLTVPDAAFLLDVAQWECCPLAGGLRLFLFEARQRAIGLFTTTAHSLADGPLRLRVPLPDGAAVVSKQGIRLWPEPQPYVLAGVPSEYREPEQDVVTADAGGVCVPVSAGFVYRRAKAPAYLLAPPGMPLPAWRQVLLAAEPAA